MREISSAGVRDVHVAQDRPSVFVTVAATFGAAANRRRTVDRGPALDSAIHCESR
jgi:hypothetical protein